MINLMPGDPFAYRGTHRKPSTAVQTAVKVTALAVPMTLAGLAVVGATPLAAHASVTHAASASAKPNWTGRTCSAFSRWQAHPATASLDKLVTFSLHLPRGYLQADVLELAADAMTAKPDQGYVDVAAQYVGEDCWGGA